jgi:hypothetical protein
MSLVASQPARAFAVPLRGITRLPTSHRFLIVCGLLLLASAAVHGAVFLVSGTAWEGPLSWRKPMLFGFSFGITAVTVAIIAAALRMRPSVAWTLLGSLGVASVAETALITMQTWRGVPSHFNFATGFDGAVFSAMGGVVAVVALALTILTILTFTSLQTSARSMAWAIRSGMVLLLVGQALGGAIIAAGVPAVIAGDDGTVFGPEGVVFGEAGILKSPHGIAMHAIQVLPLLVWLAQVAGWTERQLMPAIASGIVGYSALLGVSSFQAFTGRATLDLAVPALTVAAAGAALLIVPAIMVAASLVRRLLRRAEAV